MILRHFKKFLQLIQPVVIGDIFLLFRTFHLISGIKRNEIHLYGIFQSFVNIGMFMDHRAGRNRFQLMQIKTLNMLGLNGTGV